MANDKDFIVKEGIDVGGPTVPTLGTISSSNEVDLSTGNKFAHTPGGAVTYTFSNPGQVQTFDMQLTGGQEAVANSFNTTLYTGTGSSQTISNGIDLSGSNEGLVWIKRRDATEHNNLYDTVRGATKDLRTNATTAEGTETNGLQAFTSNGFTVGGDGLVGVNNGSYVAWTFKSTSKFFDVVTYTGSSTADGGYNRIAHSLGTDVGMLMVKRLDSTSDWEVFIRNSSGSYIGLNLNTSNMQQSTFSSGTNTINSTNFSAWYIGENTNGASYVAYLFAHDTTSDSMIKTGSFTNDSSSQNVEINLGWQPQWLLLKGYSSGSGLGSWYLKDSTRDDKRLQPNNNNAEGTSTAFELTANGFTPTTYYGGDLVYVAIRSAAATAISWPSSVQFTSGSAPSAPALNEVDNYTFSTRDGGTTYTGIQTGNNLS